MPGGPVVESPSASAGDTGSIPGLGWCHMAQSNQAHEPHLLSPYATPTEAWAPRACALQQWVAPSATGENSETAVKTQSSHTHINNYFLKIKMSSLPQWLKMLPLLFTKFQTYFFLSVDIHSCTSIILILSMEALKYVLIGDFMQIWFVHLNLRINLTQLFKEVYCYRFRENYHLCNFKPSYPRARNVFQQNTGNNLIIHKLKSGCCLF